MGCRSSESGSILREQAGVMLALCLLLVGSVACRTNPLQPRKTPLTDPVAATPAANVSVATPTRVQAPPSPAPIGARTPELPGTATPLGAPLVDLPHVVADFLAAATPAPAIAAYDRATLELLRLFYMPPGVVLQLEPESDWTPFDLKAASIPIGYRVDAVADNAARTRRAVTGHDEAADTWQIYLLDSTGQIEQVIWEAYADYRPINSPRWLGDDVLVFAQWMNPHAGAAWAFDIAARKIIAVGFLSSPDVFPPIEAYESGELLIHDPRTPIAPALGDFGSIEPHFTPNDPAWAALVQKGQPTFRVQGYTFVLDKEYWLPPYAVRLWQSDAWAKRSVTISAQSRRTVQIDSVWYMVVDDRPGLLGNGAPILEIVAGPPTGEAGLSTLLISLEDKPRVILQTDFGRPGAFEDIDSDGVSEFVVTEPPCARNFCANPAAVNSTSIYRYVAGKGWSKENGHFADLLAEERAQNEQLVTHATPGPPVEFGERPRCAVFLHVTDLLNLGRTTEAREAFDRLYKYADAEEFWLQLNLNVRSCSAVQPLATP